MGERVLRGSQRTRELSQQLSNLRLKWSIQIRVSAWVVEVVGSLSSEWNKQRSCKTAVGMSNLFLLERLETKYCLCYVLETPKKVCRIWFSVCKGGYERMTTSQEQKPALFHGLQLDIVISSFQPTDRGNRVQSMAVTVMCLAVSEKGRGVMHSWPRYKTSSHPVSERSAAESHGTAVSSTAKQRALSSSVSWWPPRFSEHGSALPCRVGDLPYSGNKIKSFEFGKQHDW